MKADIESQNYQVLTGWALLSAAMATVTGWATEQLLDCLDGLQLADGVVTARGVVRGEVSLAQRKGKRFPVYALELELPFIFKAIDDAEGNAGASAEENECVGVLYLPDISLEMIEDLEVVVTPGEATLPEGKEEEISMNGVPAVQAAVRSWATSIRKAVADAANEIPLDPPSQSMQPRAAALINEDDPVPSPEISASGVPPHCCLAWPVCAQMSVAAGPTVQRSTQ
eukprot:2151915-Pleurochrysis_carterae.AAC.4